MRGAVIVPCARCGQEMDIRDSWLVVDDRCCSPDCAKAHFQDHYKRVTDELVEQSRALYRRIARYEERARCGHMTPSV